MGNKKKFSQFNLPTVPANELYIVGYEVGTGDNGDNTSIRIKATDLAFGAAGAAGVSSINGLTNAVKLSGGSGVGVDITGNNITIHNTAAITVDGTFNPTSTNPPCGQAIANELTNYALLNDTNTFTGTQIFNDIATNYITTNTRFTSNGNTFLNGNVTIQGTDLVQALATSRTHQANTSIHLTDTDRSNIANLLQHANTQDIHLTLAEKNNFATKEELALKADLSKLETKETVTEWDNKQDWQLDKAAVKYYELASNNTVWGTITQVGIGSAAKYGDQVITTTQKPHYLMLETLNTAGEVTASYTSTNAKQMEFAKVTYWDF